MARWAKWSWQEEGHIRRLTSGWQGQHLLKKIVDPEGVCTLESPREILMPGPHPRDFVKFEKNPR